jgi:hypothetical protein
MLCHVHAVCKSHLLGTLAVLAAGKGRAGDSCRSRWVSVPKAAL